MFDRVDAFVRDVRELKTRGGACRALSRKSPRDLGFRYFALTHHVDVRRSSAAIRIHNYPDGWAEWFDEQSLGATDPVHRASNLTSVGFAWSKLPEMIALTPQDRRILDLARAQGIGEGFTVPAHVPGEAHGSCSFACRRRGTVRRAASAAAAAGRRLRVRSRAPDAPRRFPAPVQLTDRQRECVMWAARGKSDWEIARVLGISEATVGEHLRQRYERYGVGKRTLVAVHALFDGTIGFLDVLRR